MRAPPSPLAGDGRGGPKLIVPRILAVGQLDMTLARWFETPDKHVAKTDFGDLPVDLPTVW